MVQRLLKIATRSRSAFGEMPSIDRPRVTNTTRALLSLLSLLVGSVALPGVSTAQTNPCPPGFFDVPDVGCRFTVFAIPPPLGDTSLGDLPVPTPEGTLIVEPGISSPVANVSLADFVTDLDAAEALGKALFWDIQVGSDGQTSCATCHHHAGADSRVANTINPGTDGVFGSAVNGARIITGPNESLSDESFPFTVLSEVQDRLDALQIQGIWPFFSQLLHNVDDIAGSQGVIRREFTGIVPGQAADSFQEVVDPVFHDGFSNTRQVTGRNTPTTINSVYNFRQFWDGRANHIFNGSDPFGPANEGSRIWIHQAGTVSPARLDLKNSALASQAVGPPNNNVEMSFGATGLDGNRMDARTFGQLGRKLLSLRPLSKQNVSRTDSLLGQYRHPSGRGLQVGYREMIKKAFSPDYWNESATTPEGIPLMEANFSLFWGLAVQAYESTLISDDSTFDRFLREERNNGNMESVAHVFLQNSSSTLLTPEAKLGMRVFFNDGLAEPLLGAGLCAACHTGAAFSIATHQGMKVVEVEAALDPNAPPLLELEGPIEFMLMAQAGALTHATFAEQPEFSEPGAFPLDCSAPVPNPADACPVGSPWPLQGGPEGKQFGIRDNSTNLIVMSAFYPNVPTPCEEALIIPFSQTISTPAQVIAADGVPKTMLAILEVFDHRNPLTNICDNMELHIGMAGFPSGSYSLMVDGVEQIRPDGSPLITIGNDVRYDLGFYNIGVRPTDEDLGGGDRHPASLATGATAEPLSFSRRLKEGFEVPEIIGHQAIVNTDPDGNLVHLVTPSDAVIDRGSFKVPTLRNVELTGPYFHNGGKSTLAQVVDFYNRGGDFHDANIADLAPEILRLGLTPEERQGLVAFLKTLTDERVRLDQAPFDHPSLPLPQGEDVPAVGRGGRNAACVASVQSLGDRLAGVGSNVDAALDCNANGIADGCDIDNGTSLDVNFNRIPDECAQATACSDGIDQDGDGLVDLSDPDCFSTASNSEGLGWCDMDSNGQVDVLDINNLMSYAGENSSGAGDIYDRDGSGFVDIVDGLYCFAECKHFGCAINRPRCGLVGLEALLVLIPWARRKKRQTSKI